MAKNPLSTEELFSHIEDSTEFHFPVSLGGHVHIPQPFAHESSGGGHEDAAALDAGHGGHGGGHGEEFEPIWTAQTGVDVIDRTILPLDLKLTKFMILEVVVAVIIVAVFGWLAFRMRGGAAPRGAVWNLLETLLLFIRDEVARPAIGKHDADRFMPLLWTIFFFVLGCNLIGMVPWMGTPTGALATTGALAFVTFVVVLATGMIRMGVVGFWKAQVPHMDLPLPLAIVLVPMIFLIEIFGLVVKHFVLAVRLLANMLAGHIVLAVLVGFIWLAWKGGGGYFTPAFLTVMPASVVGAVALSLLELFVAFLQAYIFTFLSALFIGAAVHPH